jgi:erythronate-4-phosphate dehydrogenase
MKFVIDESIPFIHGVFEPYAEVIYKIGADICKDDLLDADALISTSRTRCNEDLLEGTSVKIIATTTIGTDHMDMDYCSRKGIYVKNASGSKSGSVMNYVFSALYGAAARKSIPLTGATFGIVGLGSVGRRVESMAMTLGFKVMRCDPPRAAAEGPERFCTLDELLEGSDIVSLHVPLNDSTRAMADADFFSKMRLGAFFINTSRGELVVEDDLIRFIPKLGPVIIDAWNNEPDIDRDLMDLVDIATPHISGYSYQGKQQGTMMAVRAIARFFSISELYDFFPPAEVEGLEAVKLDLRGKTQGEIAAILQYNYPIFTDDFMFRMDPGGFQRLRQDYRYRREYYTD